MARTAPVPNIPPIPGMNPCAFVKGGGGGGGGGSGKGGNGNGNGQGANGQGDGDGANGGGSGSGACGTGGNGACTNCGHNVSRGDPVDVLSGTVFTPAKLDLFLPGPFSLELHRSYTTMRRNTDVGIGYGWCHSLAWTLEEQRRKLVLHCGDGRRVELPRIDGLGAIDIGGWRVLRGENFYAVIPGTDFEHYFGPVEPGSRKYRLEHVRYKNRGCISLQYERGRLARALDAAGRVILFHGTNDGRRISSIAVPDPHGNTIVFARYAYDEHGNLVAATDAEGHTTYYAYDSDHRMTRLEYPSGLVFHYDYDRSGRCIETWGEYPGRSDPALSGGLDETLVDRRTPAKGIFHCKLEFAEDGSYVEVVDSVRMQRFFAGPKGTVAKAVSGRGGVTTREFDDRGRVIAQTDALGGTWTWRYDDNDKIVREVDPEGARVEVRRDVGGAEVAVIDPAGGVTEIGRDPHGEITWVKDPAGGLLQLRLNAIGLVVETIDQRGGRHLYEYDDHSNVIARTYPNGGRYRFEYDWWGRMVREVDALGAEKRFARDNTGRLTGVIDALGRSYAMAYDSMGNLIAETLPDGSTLRHEYGGLNWLCAIGHADGTAVRGRYNREGWLVEVENERGELHEFRHDPEGLITWERTFHGWEYRFDYDMLGRLVSIDDGSGPRLLTRSPAGRLLKEEAADGAVREYEYDQRGELVRAFAGDTGMEWERDPMGRILRETLQVDGLHYVIDNRREPSGDRVGYRTSLGAEFEVKRDPVGRVVEIREGEERVLGIARNAMSQPVRWDLSEGGAVVHGFDAACRLRRRQILGPDAGAATGEPQWVGQGGPGSRDILYDYTPVEEVLKVTRSDGDSIEYEYDIRRHLRKATRPSSVEEFSVDAAGNHYEAGPQAPTRTYGTGNQLLRRSDSEYAYDERGYLIEQRRTLQGGEAPEVTRYRWNAWGMLERVERPDGTVVVNAYDPFARRLAKHVFQNGERVETRHYVWDRIAVVHEVAVDEGDVKTFVYEGEGDGVPIAQRADGGWLHFINSLNGFPEELVDGAGDRVSRLDHTAFGRTWLASGSEVTTPFRFHGQLEDVETGLHYNRYRFYDPDAGRFISPDPIGIDGDFNLYRYAPNPVGWADPMGWQHVMTATGGPRGWHSSHARSRAEGTASQSTYCSGFAAGNPCPDDLANRANAHTEQKFARDLMDSGRSGTFNLQGQYPPCPTCHNALRCAAESTGSNITYQWEQPRGVTNTVNYNGSAAPTFNGVEAERLERAGYNERRENPNTTWGYSSPGTAATQYRNMVNRGWPNR